MTNKWLKLLLVASIAFNIAFLGSGIYRKVKHDARHEKYRKERAARDQHRDSRDNHRDQRKEPGLLSSFKDKLNLTPDQKEGIRKIMKQFRMNMLESKQDILDKRIAIIETFGDSEFNPEDIRLKTVELNQLENQLNLLFVDALLEVNDILDSKQRLDFLVRLSRDWFFMPERRTPPRSRAAPYGPSPDRTKGDNDDYTK